MRLQNRKNFANRTNGSKVANLIFLPAKMSRFVNLYGFKAKSTSTKNQIAH